MKILMTNDDGITSDGIVILAEKLAKLGHDVTVCSPSRNQSATSHAITVRKPYFVEKMNFEGKTAHYYAVDGKPVDCVQVGLNALKLQPDLIISGINNDKNLGSDTIYSGTVGGAVEGAFYNVKSWAISVYYGIKKQPTCDFTQAVDFILQNFERLYEMTDNSSALNINIPVKQPIQGVKICPLAKGIYDMSYFIDDMGNYTLRGVPVDYEKAPKGTDIDFVCQGYVTITPLQHDMTNYQLLERLNYV